MDHQQLIDNAVVNEKDVFEKFRFFVVNKLAGLLFKHVECFANPRDKTDWFMAERSVNNGYIWYLLGCYANRKANKLAGCTIDYVPIEQQKKFIQEALQNLNDEDMECFVGRAIWDGAFQTLEGRLPHPYGKWLYLA